MRPASAALIAVSFCSCVGTIEGPANVVPGAPTTPEAPTTAIPRASRRELEVTVRSVFGLQGAALRNLPADPASAVSPVTLAEEEVFDTLSATKDPSQVYVEGLESLAFEVARDWSANRPAVNALAGCTPPSNATDAACLGKLVDALALRLWRRAATDVERAQLLAAAAPFAADGHFVSVRAVTASMLLSPEFVYRSELGMVAGPGLVRLDNAELLARLAAFLWGDAPTADMLGALSSVELDDDALAALVDAMLADPRAKNQMRAFHQLWLRYPTLLITDATLATDMRAETDALVERALFTPGGSWQTLFTSTQTFVTPSLAAHYGLVSPGATANWVDVAAPRAGVLTHGSFLSLSSTRGTDTLPSRRGAMIARRTLCQVVLPPPKDVNIDDGVPVPPGSCKAESYAAHRSRGACAGCHATIDGVGFGFEPLDGQGRLRASDEGNASCTLDGRGTAMGVPFTGAREFVTSQVEVVTRCAVTNLLRFAYRDRFVPDARIDSFHAAFRSTNHDFATLMRSVALDPRFRLRVAEQEGAQP